jgi:type I restriction enzyme S subunit
MGVFRSDLNDFIFYAFQSDYVQRQVREHLGATINQITSKSLKAFKIALPTDPDEISAIAEALNDADAQVVTLKKLIEKKRHIKQGAMQDLLSGRTRLPKFRGEWRIEQLGDLLSCRPEYGINAPAVPYDLRHPAYIRITDITDDGRFDPSSRASVVHPNADCYRLEAGDIVLARTGASTGKSYFYREQDGDLVFAGFLIRVRPDQNQLSPQYLRYQLQTETYWRWVRTNSMRSGQPGINGQQYASMPIAIPPTRAEQNAIAEALADMDAQLEALEARLEKARQVKQGMMQELLTGRVRLV